MLHQFLRAIRNSEDIIIVVGDVQSNNLWHTNNSYAFSIHKNYYVQRGVKKNMKISAMMVKYNVTCLWR